MAERDFAKYQRLYKNNQNPAHVSMEDLLAIQQIELDRGNYNRPPETLVYGDSRQLRPQKSPKKHDRPKESRNRHDRPKESRHDRDRDRRRDRESKARDRGDKSRDRNRPREKSSKQKDPNYVRPVPIDSNENRLSDAGTGSVESFGEFHSPKTGMAPRRLVYL